MIVIISCFSVYTFDKMRRVLSKSTLQQRFIEQMRANERIDKRLSDLGNDIVSNPSLLKDSLG